MKFLLMLPNVVTDALPPEFETLEALDQYAKTVLGVNGWRRWREGMSGYYSEAVGPDGLYIGIQAFCHEWPYGKGTA